MANVTVISIPFTIADIATAQTILIPVTENMVGRVSQVRTCLGSAISGADSLIVISKNTTVLGTMTVAYTSSAAGDIDVLNINTQTGYLAAGDYIKIANGGESTATSAPTTGVIDIVR